MNQDKISNSPDCFRNKAMLWEVYAQIYHCSTLNGLRHSNFINAHAQHLHLHKISNLTKKIVLIGQFTLIIKF